MGFIHRFTSSYGVTRHYETTTSSESAPAGSGGWYGGSPFAASGTYAELRVYKSALWNEAYQTRIYYRGSLILDTGLSSLTNTPGYQNQANTMGQPLNWPPPAAGGALPKTTGYAERAHERRDEDEGQIDITDYYTKVGSTAQLFFYLGPDQYYGNNSYMANSSAINPAGSHFLIGSFKDYRKTLSMASNPWIDTGYNTNYSTGDGRWYYELIKLSGPPSIYRNSVGYEDAADNDYNDSLFTLNSGDGFFTGTFLTNSTAPTTINYTVSGYNAAWSRFSGHTFIANTTGTYTFTILRDSNYFNRLLLYKGSGNNDYSIIEPDSQVNSIRSNVSTYLNAGTYEVAIQSNTNTNSSGRMKVCSIGVDKYPNYVGQ